MENDAKSRFAHELGLALEACGQGLDVVLCSLKAEGFAVPARAFDNWLKGYFLPRSEASGELVSAIERVLGAEPSSLVQALAADLLSGRSFVPGEDVRSYQPASAALVDGVLDQNFTCSDKETDWAAECIRVALEDHLALSEDLCDLTHTVVTWVRVPAAPNPSFNVPVVYEPEDLRIDGRLIYDIEGAELAGQKVYEIAEGQVNITSRLVLPFDVNPGELHRVAFSCGYAHTGDTKFAAERIFPWPLEKYSCHVRFRGRVPEGLEYIFQKYGADGEVVEKTAHPLKVEDGLVKVEITDVPKGIGCLRWS